MLRRRVYFFGALIAVVAFLMVDYNLHKKVILSKIGQRSLAADLEKQKNSDTVKSQITKLDDQKLDQSLKSFRADFVKESLSIGQIQNDPDQAELRLQVMADNLTAEQIKYLSTVLTDLNLNGDERTLAVELLSLNTGLEAHQALKAFVENEIFGFGARVDFELALRAQAVEGLVNCSDKSVVAQSLDYLKQKTKYSFLHDREERALNFVKGYADSPQQQDNEALKKLITK